MPDHQLRKEERLSSRTQLNTLFSQGKSFVVFPVRFVWMIADRNGDFPARVAFSVSKKFWKRAVDRNLLKRRMREAYRADKEVLYKSSLLPSQQIILACLYIADKAFISDDIHHSMHKGLHKIATSIPTHATQHTET